MRRFSVLIFAAVALFAGACGGGDDKDATGDPVSDAASGLSKVAAADVCGGREALNVGAAFAQAASGNPGSVDYTDVADGLRKAAKAAPAEIRDDFVIVADALGPYLKTFEEAKGDYMKLAQDPAFQAASQRLADSKYTEASTRISNWFADHCK